MDIHIRQYWKNPAITSSVWGLGVFWGGQAPLCNCMAIVLLSNKEKRNEHSNNLDFANFISLCCYRIFLNYKIGTNLVRKLPVNKIISCHKPVL